MNSNILKCGDLVFCTRCNVMQSRLSRMGYQSEIVSNTSTYTVLKITGNTGVTIRRYHVCSECKYLTSENKSVGNKCTRPNWKWRTKTAMWKSPTAKVCIAFVPKEGKDV